MSKRKPGTELNHENWDKEEAAEDSGVFQKAPSELLESRKMLRPKRRLAKPVPTSTATPSEAFSGFSSTMKSSPFAQFSFPVLSPSTKVDNDQESTALLKPASISEVPPKQNSESEGITVNSPTISVSQEDCNVSTEVDNVAQDKLQIWKAHSTEILDDKTVLPDSNLADGQLGTTDANSTHQTDTTLVLQEGNVTVASSSAEVPELTQEILVTTTENETEIFVEQNKV